MALFCKICNVEIPSELVMECHLKGKRHCRFAEEQRKRKEDSECSIFVRGFPAGTTDHQLKLFFNRFGTVTNVFLEKERGQFAFVKFQSPETVSAVLSPQFGPVYIGNCRLTIKLREYRHVTPAAKRQAPPKTSADDTSKNDSSALLLKLSKCADVEQQMYLLQKEIQLSCQEIQQRDYIRRQLQELFQSRIPGCQVFLFGSSVSGVGMHGCDMDIFLDIATDHSVQQNDHSDDQCSAVLNSASKLLRRCHGFTNVFVIRSARCPLIKFEHVQSGLKCDLSMNNRLALQNTRLINLLCNVDPRVQPLMYNIRYWAKLKELAGNPSGGLRVTNYALTMMVIFYLQQLEIPILPSVEKLARLALDVGQTCTIDGWDCSFCADLDKLWSTAAANTESLCQLLGGFFSFYATFDLGNSVICPRTGAAVDITTFSGRMKEEERLAQFKISPMCVQDPFVLSHNVMSNANERVKVRFIAEVQAASDPFSQPDFSVRTETRPWGIAGLLAAGPLADGAVAVAPSVRSDSVYSFTIAMESSKLPASYVQKFSSVTDLKDGWSRDLCTLIRRLLEDVLYFECKETKEEESQCGTNREESSEKKQTGALRDSLQCKDNASTMHMGKDSAASESEATMFVSDVSCDEERTGNEHGKESSSLKMSEANASKLPNQTTSGEIRKTSKEMDQLDITRAATPVSDALPEPGVERELLDSMEMDLQECQVGKRPSSENLVETTISKRSRPEDKSRCCPKVPSDQSASEDVIVTTRPAPKQSTTVTTADLPSQSTTEARQPCTEIQPDSVGMESALVDSQQVGAEARSDARRDMTRDVTSGLDTTEPETTPEKVTPTSPSSRPLDGTKRKTGLLDLSVGSTGGGRISCLHCISKSGVWSGRKKFHKTLKRSSLTGIDAEIEISKLLALKLGEDGELIPCIDFRFSFRLKFTALNSHGHTVLVVDMDPTSGAKMFSCFYTFFKSFVNKHTRLAFT